MLNAAKIFGAGVTSVPKLVPPTPVEIRKDDKGIAFVIYVHRLPSLDAQKVWGRVSEVAKLALQIDDPEDSLQRLLEGVKLLTRPRGPKKKRPVIAEMEGLTLANFQAVVNDHQDYQGEIFDLMRQDPTRTFPFLVKDEKTGEQHPTILEYVLAQSAAVRLAVLAKMSEQIEDEKKNQEGKDPASESSSE